MPAKFPRLVAIAVTIGLASAPLAHARHRGGNDRGEDFNGRDFNHFSRAERGLWRGGHWEHGWHDGRFAWWWFAGGGWYSYPAPTYPYPTYIPTTIIVQPRPPVPSGLPPLQLWYFCDSPQGYYPYVATCSGPWHPVPVTPQK